MMFEHQEHDQRGEWFVHDQIDVICDRFEQAWKSGGVPQIEDYLDLDEEPFRRNLCDWLVLLDMDYRWRVSCRPGAKEHAAASDRLGLRPLLEDYVTLGVEYGAVEQLSLRLVVEEYRTRNRWWDYPPHEEFLARFPRHAGELTKTLCSADEQMARDAARLQVKVYRDRQFVFGTGMVRPLELGRRRRDEEGPYSCTPQNAGFRLVVADAQEKKLARRTVRLEPLSDGQVRVTNCRHQGSIAVDQVAALKAGSCCDVCVPFRLLLGNIVVGAEPVRCR